MNCIPFYKKANLLIVFILLISFCIAAQKNNSSRDIEYYFNRLPDSCFYLCDWRNAMAKSGIRTLDRKNGFISFKRNSDEIDFFQAALFRDSNNENYIAVSTRECEAFTCFHPKSFFFIYKKEAWVPADAILFAGVTTRLFYSDTSLYRLSEKYSGYFRFNFILPQKGTRVRVELDVCDYLTTDHPEVSNLQYKKLISEKKTVILQWNRIEKQFDVKGTKEKQRGRSKKAGLPVWQSAKMYKPGRELLHHDSIF